MTQKEYKIISTKCPVRSENFLGINSCGPDSEILLRLKDNEPVDIICPKYQNKGRCEYKIKGDSHVNDPQSKCIYCVGWKPLK